MYVLGSLASLCVSRDRPPGHPMPSLVMPARPDSASHAYLPYLCFLFHPFDRSSIHLHSTSTACNPRGIYTSQVWLFMFSFFAGWA
mgnify:CR=1 FL=1